MIYCTCEGVLQTKKRIRGRICQSKTVHTRDNRYKEGKVVKLWQPETS